MPVIASVDARSPAEKAGVRPGDVLKAVNGHPIADVLDYLFYTAEPVLRLQILRGGKAHTVLVRNPMGKPLGLGFETYLIDRKTHCANRCVFCFIDQLPAGLRESLYFKDDDMRLSFLMGNYITLTNLSAREMARIQQMKISPIHVSVHATNPAVRQTLCGTPRAGDCFERMHTLAAAGIEMHCQIVVCPGINDGAVLEQTCADLAMLYPHVASVSVVPVGLTKYRDGLYPLRTVDEHSAADILDTVNRIAARMLVAHGTAVFFCADELYLTAHRPLPSDAQYEAYPQLENGVGMLRLLITEFDAAMDALPDDYAPAPFRCTVATGTAAAPVLRTLTDRVNERFPQCVCTVRAVENRFFGETVTVAGLLTGQDLIAQLSGCDLGAQLLLAASVVNNDGVMLDGCTPVDLAQALGVPVRLVANDGALYLAALCNRAL